MNLPRSSRRERNPSQASGLLFLKGHSTFVFLLALGPSTAVAICLTAIGQATLRVAGAAMLQGSGSCSRLPMRADAGDAIAEVSLGLQAAERRHPLQRVGLLAPLGKRCQRRASSSSRAAACLSFLAKAGMCWPEPSDSAAYRRSGIAWSQAGGYERLDDARRHPTGAAGRRTRRGRHAGALRCSTPSCVLSS